MNKIYFLNIFFVFDFSGNAQDGNNPPHLRGLYFLTFTKYKVYEGTNHSKTKLFAFSNSQKASSNQPKRYRNEGMAC